jgi:hypothetical protein
MATKVTILGSSSKESPKKPIEFVKFLSGIEKIVKFDSTPNSFNNIELICLKYNAIFDLMYAYGDDRNDGLLILGHFNDGVV